MEYWKVYLKGNPVRFERCLMHLESYGGVNVKNIKCDNKDKLYYINKEKEIAQVEDTEQNRTFLHKLHYEEIYIDFWKVFIKGVPGYGNEIAKLLQEKYLADNVNSISFDNPDIYYFVDKHLKMNVINDKEYLIKNGYKEIFLENKFPKVCVHGVRERGNEIIRLLVDKYGAENPFSFSCESEQHFYYIDEFGRIDGFPESNRHLFPEYTEVFLPDETIDKVYIRGNNNRAAEIKSMLIEKYGAHKSAFPTCNASNWFYYVAPDRSLRYIETVEDLEQMKKDGYREIFLPEKKPVNRPEKWKFFIQGNFERSGEVLKTLIDLGARNRNAYLNTHDRKIYAIDESMSIVSYDRGVRNYLIEHGYTELHLEEKFDAFERVMVRTRSGHWKLDFYSHKDAAGKHVCMYNAHPKEVIAFDKSKISLLIEKNNKKIK